MPHQPAPPPSVVRLPEALRTWLKHRAIDNHRTFSGEVIHRLQQSRQQEEGQIDVPSAAQRQQKGTQ